MQTVCRMSCWRAAVTTSPYSTGSKSEHSACGSGTQQLTLTATFTFVVKPALLLSCVFSSHAMGGVSPETLDIGHLSS